MEPCRQKRDNPLVSFEHVIAGSDHLVKVCGELDVYTAPRLTAALKNISSADRIVVDLTKCRYLGGSAVSALVRARRTSRIPISLVLDERSMLRRILRITNVDGLFALFSTVEAALAFGHDVTEQIQPGDDRRKRTRLDFENMRAIRLFI